MGTNRYWLSVSYYNGKKKSFDGCKTYSYYVDVPAKAKAWPAPGTFLVVMDPVTYDALKVVRVNRVYLTKQDAVKNTKDDDEFLHKEFVGFADVGGYFGREAARERIKELSERLRVLVERAEKLAMYKKLAETDSEVRETLDTMAELAKEYDVPLDL